MAATVSGLPKATQVAELSRRECLMLLSTKPIGRIVYTASGLPAVIPVGYLVERGDVGGDTLLCAVTGTWLLAPIDGAVVALQADEVERDMDAGWWVTIVGRAEPVREEREAAELRADPRWPRPIDESEEILRLRPGFTSGRRIVSAEREV